MRCEIPALASLLIARNWLMPLETIFQSQLFDQLFFLRF
jgi:hypothetical protein